MIFCLASFYTIIPRCWFFAGNFPNLHKNTMLEYTWFKKNVINMVIAHFTHFVKRIECNFEDHNNAQNNIMRMMSRIFYNWIRIVIKFSKWTIGSKASREFQGEDVFSTFARFPEGKSRRRVMNVKSVKP